MGAYLTYINLSAGKGKQVIAFLIDVRCRWIPQMTAENANLAKKIPFLTKKKYFFSRSNFTPMHMSNKYIFLDSAGTWSAKVCLPLLIHKERPFLFTNRSLRRHMCKLTRTYFLTDNWTAQVQLWIGCSLGKRLSLIDISFTDSYITQCFSRARRWLPRGYNLGSVLRRIFFPLADSKHEVKSPAKVYHILWNWATKQTYVIRLVKILCSRQCAIFKRSLNIP
jgi:hypothetical protein